MQYIKDWKVSYVCDRCKDILEYHPTPVLGMDFCDSCMDSFKEWLRAPIPTEVDGINYYVVQRDNKLILERPFRKLEEFDTKQELMEYLRRESSPCMKCTPETRAACTGCPEYEIWRNKNIT